jgi:hypothetical protein
VGWTSARVNGCLETRLSVTCRRRDGNCTDDFALGALVALEPGTRLFSDEARARLLPPAPSGDDKGQGQEAAAAATAVAGAATWQHPPPGYTRSLRCAGNACFLRLTRLEDDRDDAPAPTPAPPSSPSSGSGGGAGRVDGALVVLGQWLLLGGGALLEWAAFVAGVLLCLRRTGVLARSRLRYNQTTGLPVVCPPRSGSSGATHAAVHAPRHSSFAPERDRSASAGAVQEAAVGGRPFPTGLHYPAALVELADGLGLLSYVAPQARPGVRPVIDPTPPSRQEYFKVSRALLVASFPRVFACLSMVWTYDPVPFLMVISVLAVSSQATALQALCDCPFADAAVLIAGGQLCAAAVRVLLQLIAWAV